VLLLSWKEVKEKQFYFFLFNDLLVCCDKRGSKRTKDEGEGFILMFTLPFTTVIRVGSAPTPLLILLLFSTLTLRTRPTEELQKGKLMLVVCEERGKEKLNYNLTIKDKRDRAMWFADLKTCVAECNGK